VIIGDNKKERVVLLANRSLRKTEFVRVRGYIALETTRKNKEDTSYPLTLVKMKYVMIN
jgi:hypothetical protein